MQRIIFLDRDGVINYERGDHTWRVDDLDINEGVVEALTELQQAGYKFVIITNQSGIAKGKYKHKDAREVNEVIREFLQQEGIELLDIYYCPHHPTKSKCLCRKPDSLMLEKALARFKGDPAQSWFIGDQPRDCEAGAKAGVNTVLIEPNDDLRKYLGQILNKNEKQLDTTK